LRSSLLQQPDSLVKFLQPHCYRLHCFRKSLNLGNSFYNSHLRRRFPFCDTLKHIKNGTSAG
jgi:hypothetical protein